MFDTDVPGNLEQIPPGAELGRILATLDWENLSDYDLIRVLQAQDRQVSHYQAGRAWTMNKIAERYEERGRGWAVNQETFNGTAAEIGAALRLTRRSSEDQTGFAIELCRNRTEVFEALLFGRIDTARARILVDGTQHVSEGNAHDVLEQVLPDAGRLTTGQLRHRLEKLCIDVDPDEAKKRYAVAHENRRIELRPTLSGTADLLALDIDPKDAAEIKGWVHREAIKLRRLGDSRTMDQLRTDIYVDLLKRRYHGGRSASGDGGVHLDVTPDVLAGLSEASGDLRGYGPVTSDIARQIAEQQVNGEWTWTYRDPDTGQPIMSGTTRRRPTKSQQRHVRAHNPTCAHPGCRMPAVDCDIDHRIPWSERRVTCTGDLAPLCRHHHHRVRHTWGWTYERLPGGDWAFTTPLGHRYTTSGRPP